MRVNKQVPFFTLFILLSDFATDGLWCSSAFFVHHDTKRRSLSINFVPSFTSTASSLVRLSADNNNNNKVAVADNDDDDDDDDDTGGIQQELERLQDQLQYIEAIEARNKAQLDSFVDEEDQWNSMDEEERELLKSKDVIQQKMELLTEQLVMLWMGQKSQDG